MPDIVTEATPKSTLIDRGYNYSKRQARIEEEEKEIAKLEAKSRQGSDQPEEEEVKEIEETNSEAEETSLSGEEKSFKKRYGDIRRHLADKEKEWEEKFNALSGQGTMVPPKSDEDIAAWVEKYPDVAGIVETIAAKKAKELFSKAEKKLQDIDKVQEDIRRKELEAQIIEEHSDFNELKSSDKFHSWADEQPKWVQDALYENSDDPASVVRVIDLYKIDNDMTTKARKSNKKAAAGVVSKRSKPSIDAEDASGKIRESDVAKMSAKQFEENEVRINEALRSDRFIYDISGGAR
jgi:hypothetical protein